ncbi:amidohydrolase [Thermodesulfobacteriota bacterium]
MHDLAVTILQMDLVWEDIYANLTNFDKTIDQIDTYTDLIILPEMFTTGFTMKATGHAETMEGSAVQWLKDKAHKKRTDIVGSVIIREERKYFNRLIWAKPDGKLFTYDKRHLFRMAGEEKVYHPGDRNITVSLRGWNLRPFICYDLRFPLWTRNSNNQYDVAIFIANWPEKRSVHWKVLLQARAIENQCYVIGVNRIGKDGNDLIYSGESSIFDPVGNTLFQKSDVPCIQTARLSYDILSSYRESFAAWMDADNHSASIGSAIDHLESPQK